MISGTCWQYLKKREAALRVAPPAITDNEVVVSPLSFATAKAFVEGYEWLGHMGAAKYCYGLSVGGSLAAAVCYGSPSAPGAFRRLLGDEMGRSVLQLCRGASAPWAPRWVGSRLISRSLRDLYQRFAPAAVVAFADPRAGEVGVVYQASNAIYLGLTQSRGPGEYLICGRRYHARAVPKHFGSAAHHHLVRVDPRYRRFQRTKKHRYLFVLVRGSRRVRLLDRIRHLIEPHPHRLIGALETTDSRTVQLAALR